YMLENALVAGITSFGVDVLLIGPLPTPGVAYITRSLRADAGIVLSASHNPYEDNGIKFFRHDGYKLDDQIEQQIEQLVFTGELVDGDEILAIAAVDLLESGCLQENTLVATIMSNFGLDEALAPLGGKVVRAKVGDRYVIEAMVEKNLNLGGEQSGHMIFRDFTTTGDGIISALQILRIMKTTGKPLSELKRCLRKYPQAQRNLRVKEKRPLEEL